MLVNDPSKLCQPQLVLNYITKRLFCIEEDR